MTVKDIILLLVLYSSFQAFILFVVFLLKKSNKTANCLFGVTMLTFSFHLVFNYLNWKGYIATPELIDLLPIKPVVWYLYGPLLYLYYLKLLIDKGFSLKDTIHIIPLCIYLIFHFPAILIPSSQKLRLLQNSDVGLLFNVNLAFIYIGVLLLYLILIYRLLFIKLSLPVHIKTWAKWTFYPFVVYFVFLSGIYVLASNGLIVINSKYEYLIGFLIILPIWVTTYFAYFQPDIFSGKKVFNGFTFGKYQNSGLTERFSIELRDKLILLLSNEEVYRKSDLTLDDISEKLDTSRHNTSQVINEHFGVSFFELLNKYRMEKAKEIFKADSQENLSIFDVAIEVGYNNRTTFNKAFKKSTGLTPTEFRKSVRR